MAYIGNKDTTFNYFKQMVKAAVDTLTKFSCVENQRLLLAFSLELVAWQLHLTFFEGPGARAGRDLWVVDLISMQS